MPQPAQAVTVLVASPGDTAEERAAVRNILTDWNLSTGRRLSVAALPWLYERNAVPQMGGRPQALINRQAVDRSDIVVAFFDSRLGSPTGVDVSGTAEEIHRAMDLGKPVHVYFSEEDLPRDVDPAQLAALNAFRDDLKDKGLLGSYADPDDLASQVVRAVEHDVEEQGWANVTVRPGRAGAALRWHHDHRKEPKGYDRKGRMQYRTVANRLVVSNESDVDATDFVFETTWEGDPPTVAPKIDDHSGPVTIPARSQKQWLCIPLYSGNLVIHGKWTENGQPREQTWSVTVGR